MDELVQHWSKAYYVNASEEVATMELEILFLTTPNDISVATTSKVRTVVILELLQDRM
jgi:hypothetical protein